MIEKIKNIILKYIKEQNIEDITTGENKVVIVLKNADEEISDKLKAEIENISGNAKISIVFVKEKETSSLNQKADDKWNVKNVKKIIVVASGKGGVGKSTTSVNLALALADTGLKVALFDADIYGPSIPQMLGYENIGAYSADGINFEPFKYGNIQSMSIGTLIEKDTPLIWRGAKACGAIQQLLEQTAWKKNTDVMVLDMPPGTGDIQISIAQKVALDGVVIVSTPQDIALIDAVRGINMFKKLDIPILGIIENMSYYICEKCGHRADIFGHHGTIETAQKMGENFLGEIPLNIAIRKNSDSGTPIVISEPDSKYTQSYRDIAGKIKTMLFG